VNPTVVDFSGLNKCALKEIQEKNKLREKEQKAFQDIEDAKTPFKMDKFKKIPPKIVT
jgi:hypothetical protein